MLSGSRPPLPAPENCILFSLDGRGHFSSLQLSLNTLSLLQKEVLVGEYNLM